MSKIIQWWCDSGANIHSCLNDEISTEDMGLTDEEWDSMPEEDKVDMMREIALDRLDWGFKEKE